MIWQSVLVVVICYLYIYLDFSCIYDLFLLLPWLRWIKIIIIALLLCGVDYSRHLATLSEYLGRESEWDGVESISMRVPGGVTSNESTYNASPTYSIPHTNYHTIYVFLINSVPVARPRDIAVSETVFYRRMKIKHNNVRERGRNRQTERGATLSQNGDFVQRLMQIYSTRKKQTKYTICTACSYI